MDSADSFHSALSHQGLLLGEHEKALRSLNDQQGHCNQRLDQVLEMIVKMNDHLSTLSTVSPADGNPPMPPQVPVPPTPLAEPQFRNITFPTPDSYAGDVGGCEGFLLQCTLAMTQAPRSFPSDSAKISFVIGLLKDKALAWALAFSRTNTLEGYPFADFVEKFRTTFNHPLGHNNASKRLLNLRQGTQSVADFLIEFRILAAETGWGTDALRGILLNSLNDQIKDQLAFRDEPASFEELASLAVRVDNRIRERRKERDSNSHKPLHGYPSPNSNFPRPHEGRARAGAYLPPLPQVSHPGDNRSTTNTEVTEPMQLGRTRLTLEERSRRMRNKECLYCGSPRHFISSCSVRPNDYAHQ